MFFEPKLGRRCLPGMFGHAPTEPQEHAGKEEKSAGVVREQMRDLRGRKDLQIDHIEAFCSYGDDSEENL